MRTATENNMPREHKYPDLCETCGNPYVEPSSPDHNTAPGWFCSSGFHCCRDCTWVDGQVTEDCAHHQAHKENDT